MKIVLTAASALAATLALAAVASPASAQSTPATDTGWYVNLGASSHDTNGVNNLGTVDGRVGYRANRWLAVEGEAGFGINDKTVAANTQAKIDNHEGLYAVGLLPVSSNLDLFARVGWARTDVSVKGTGGFSGRGDASGLSYGAGAQYMFDGKNGIRGDYTRDDFNHGDHANVWGVSYVRKF
jgi:outer membrane immunogenic protein